MPAEPPSHSAEEQKGDWTGAFGGAYWCSCAQGMGQLWLFAGGGAGSIWRVKLTTCPLSA